MMAMMQPLLVLVLATRAVVGWPWQYTLRHRCSLPPVADRVTLSLDSSSTLGHRFLPCEDVQVSIAGLSATSTSAWLFDASAGAFHSSPAHAGCDGKRWQSWNRDTASSTNSVAVLRMPGDGTVVLHGAHATSTDAQMECAVMVTEPISLAVDPAGDDSACVAALPAHAPPGGDSDVAPPLPPGMKAHGCLQSIAWLLLLFPGAMVARYKSIFFHSMNGSKRVSIALLGGEEQDDGQSPAGVDAASSAGVETWFTLHRGAQSMGSLASIAGVAVAWSSTGGFSLMHWHNRLGGVLPLVLLAQFVMGVCRPAKGNVAKRQQFLLVHRVLGGVSLLLGMFCVCTGTHMSYGEPVTAYYGAVMGCIGVACALVGACEFKLRGAGTAQPALMWASFAALAVAGVVSVAGILLVGHYHVHVDDAR